MEIANNMKELTDNIASSARERAEALKIIKENTKTSLKESADMLIDFSTARAVEISKLRQELKQNSDERRKEVAEILKNAHSIISDYGDSRKKSGDQLRKELIQNSKVIIQNEKKRKQEIEKMIDAFQTSRQETGDELRKNLADTKARIQLEVKEALTDVKTLISGYQSSRQTMGVELRKDLGDIINERKAEIGGMRQDIRRGQEEVRSEVKKAADAWRALGVGNKKNTANEKTKPSLTPERKVETKSNLENKLLSIIKTHPEGISLLAVAKQLGTVTVVLGKTAKALLDKGKVRKENKMYFPVGK